MRKRAVSVEEIKNEVAALAGRRLKISVNKGRKKVARYEGELSGIYPGVFVLNIFNDRTIASLSFSYSDVICGDIKLRAATPDQ